MHVYFDLPVIISLNQVTRIFKHTWLMFMQMLKSIYKFTGSLCWSVLVLHNLLMGHVRNIHQWNYSAAGAHFDNMVQLWSRRGLLKIKWKCFPFQAVVCVSGLIAANVGRQNDFTASLTYDPDGLPLGFLYQGTPPTKNHHHHTHVGSLPYQVAKFTF